MAAVLMAAPTVPVHSPPPGGDSPTRRGDTVHLAELTLGRGRHVQPRILAVTALSPSLRGPTIAERAGPQRARARQPEACGGFVKPDGGAQLLIGHGAVLDVQTPDPPAFCAASDPAAALLDLEAGLVRLLRRGSTATSRFHDACA